MKIIIKEAPDYNICLWEMRTAAFCVASVCSPCVRIAPGPLLSFFLAAVFDCNNPRELKLPQGMCDCMSDTHIFKKENTHL